MVDNYKKTQGCLDRAFEHGVECRSPFCSVDVRNVEVG